MSVLLVHTSYYRLNNRAKKDGWLCNASGSGGRDEWKWMDWEVEERGFIKEWERTEERSGQVQPSSFGFCSWLPRSVARRWPLYEQPSVLPVAGALNSFPPMSFPQFRCTISIKWGGELFFFCPLRVSIVMPDVTTFYGYCNVRCNSQFLFEHFSTSEKRGGGCVMRVTFERFVLNEVNRHKVDAE